MAWNEKSIGLVALWCKSTKISLGGLALGPGPHLYEVWSITSAQNTDAHLYRVNLDDFDYSSPNT